MKLSTGIVAFVAALAFAGSAHAQNSASATATANADVVCPIAITHITGVDAELNFGRLVGGGSAGTVTVPDLSLSATYTGGCSPFSGSGGTGTISPAHFVIYAQQGFAISIVGPNTVTISSGTHTMQIAMFFPAASSYVGEVNSTVGGNNMSIYTMNGTHLTGDCSVRRGLDLGGVLSVSAGQAPGIYTGSFTEVVSYN